MIIASNEGICIEFLRKYTESSRLFEFI